MPLVRLTPDPQALCKNAKTMCQAMCQAMCHGKHGCKDLVLSQCGDHVSGHVSW